MLQNFLKCGCVATVCAVSFSMSLIHMPGKSNNMDSNYHVDTILAFRTHTHTNPYNIYADAKYSSLKYFKDKRRTESLFTLVEIK